jgi:hypothetical protein
MGLTPAAESPSDSSEEYPLAIHSSHLFVNLGRGASVLVDTGAPFSFGDLNGHAEARPSDMLGKVSEFIKFKVTGLIGLDWLAQRGFEIDLRTEGQFKLRRFGPARKGGALDIMRSLRTEVVFGNDRYNAFCDTGAPISYLSSIPKPADPNPVRATDFTILGGSFRVFDVELHRQIASLHKNPSIRRSIHVAQGESVVIDAISELQADAIIGLEFLRGCRLTSTHDGKLSISQSAPASSPTKTKSQVSFPKLIDDPIGGDDEESAQASVEPMPLPESLRSFWPIAAEQSEVVRRAHIQLDGASMLFLPPDGRPGTVIRSDLEVAIARDGAETLASALAHVSIELNPEGAKQALRMLAISAPSIAKLLDELLNNGAEIILRSDRLDMELTDHELQDASCDFDFRLGAKLTIRYAFTFSDDFRNNDRADTRILARALKLLDQLLRQIDRD